MSIKLDYDDVLIRPKRSDAPSRADIVLEKKYKMLNSGKTWEGIPVLAANLDTTGTIAMADAMADFKMGVCLHKYYEPKKLIDFFFNVFRSQHCFYTMGIKDLEKFDDVCKHTQIPNICLDVANGYTKYFVDHVKKVREKYPNAILMVGNVATPEMVQELLMSGGADVVKIGIGPGSLCKTRIITGVGYPQLSAVLECAEAAHGLRGHICADGGCKTPGDICKAFGAGADFVMIGGMLAGCKECEGWDDKLDILSAYGMSSKKANDKYSGGLKDYRASEGREVKIKYKGLVKNILQEITGGLRSCCALVGASNLKDLPKCTTFIRVNNTHNRMFE